MPHTLSLQIKKMLIKFCWGTLKDDIFETDTWFFEIIHILAVIIVGHDLTFW